MSLVEDLSLRSDSGNESAKKSDIVSEINKENEEIVEESENMPLCELCGEKRAEYYLPIGYICPSPNLCKNCFEDVIATFFWGFGGFGMCF